METQRLGPLYPKTPKPLTKNWVSIGSLEAMRHHAHPAGGKALWYQPIRDPRYKVGSWREPAIDRKTAMLSWSRVSKS